jgi:hypothetical protein
MRLSSSLIRTLLFSLATVTMIACRAEAGLMLAFTSDGSEAAFALSPGAAADIPIYLVQTSNSMTHPDFTNGYGLNVFGVAGSLQGEGVSIVNDPFTFDSPFQDQGILNPSTSTLSSFVMNGFDPRVGSPGKDGGTILLGSIAVQGNTPGAVTTLTFADPAASLDDFAASPNFGSFDAEVFSSTPAARITVVPEPSATLLAVFAVLGLLNSHRGWRM